MGILVFLAIIACIPAAIAKGKGRSFFGWWVYSCCLWIVAFIHSLCLSREVHVSPVVVNVATVVDQSSRSESRQVKSCPECGEEVLADARICRFCRHEFWAPLLADTVRAQPSIAIEQKAKSNGVKVCGGCGFRSPQQSVVCRECGRGFR
jgi:ribosomal protein L40E